MTKRTRLFDIIIFGLVICIFFFSYTIYKGYEDVSGIIIGKSEEVSSNRKTTKYIQTMCSLYTRMITDCLILI